MRIDTWDGILHVANYVHDPRTPLPAMVKSVDVYLPNDNANPSEIYYADYLLKHRRPNVRLHYTEADLCLQR